MASTDTVQIDRQRIAELTDKEEARLEAATPSRSSSFSGL